LQTHTLDLDLVFRKSGIDPNDKGKADHALTANEANSAWVPSSNWATTDIQPPSMK
jgi:hypothetical protein